MVGYLFLLNEKFQCHFGDFLAVLRFEFFSIIFPTTEHHNQKYERKRNYSVTSTPKISSRSAAENRVGQSDGPRKKRAAAISAGKKTDISN